MPQNIFNMTNRRLFLCNDSNWRGSGHQQHWPYWAGVVLCSVFTFWPFASALVQSDYAASGQVVIMCDVAGWGRICNCLWWQDTMTYWWVTCDATVSLGIINGTMIGWQNIQIMLTGIWKAQFSLDHGIYFSEPIRNGWKPLYFIFVKIA